VADPCSTENESGSPNEQDDWRPEVEAMQSMVSALQPLNHEQRLRIMAAAICMHDQAMAERVMRWWRDSQ
jgi:hypothetical protein